MTSEEKLKLDEERKEKLYIMAEVSDLMGMVDRLDYSYKDEINQILSDAYDKLRFEHDELWNMMFPSKSVTKYKKS